MKAYDIDNKELVLKDFPDPTIGKNEVLIDVRAAGINRPDIFQRMGHYPPPAGVTEIPGLEVSGNVFKSNHPAWKNGDWVCALIPGGGYAEKAKAHGDHCLPIPEGLTFTESASLPETYFTVWNNLFYRNNFQSGQTILIHGGASGIGTSAIQIVRAMGGIPYVTAGTSEKCAACLDLGAEAAIHYKQEKFDERIQDLTNGFGVDLILDMVGGNYFEKNIKSLAEEGTHISIAHLEGSKGTVPIRTIMMKRLKVTGSTLRARPDNEKADIARSLKAHIWPALESKDITPVIFERVPFENAMKAHKIIEKGNHIGKIVLTRDPENQ